MDNQTALVVNGESIGARDLLHGMKVRHGAAFLEEAIQEALIRQAARDSITVSDEELQLAADEFRRAAGLFEVDATEGWLARSGMTVEDFEERLSLQVLARKLRDQVTEGQVEAYFAQNRPGFDQALVSQLVVRDEGLAAELAAQVTEEGAAFPALAKEHSIDSQTRDRGGFVGLVSRQALGAEAEAFVFAAGPGEVVGPARLAGGWALFQVHALLPAELDEATQHRIREALFGQWLQEERNRATVETPLLDTV